MPAEIRNSLADTATALATAVKSNDTSKLQAATVAELASNFAPTAYVVRSTAAKLTGDTLRVTQVYRLDASTRKPDDTSEAEFTCALAGTTAETDFSIPGLPPGVYGFAMVEAGGGEHPLLLAFLLRQAGAPGAAADPRAAADWKMAGFYPRARTAAGHDGLWYWTTARADAQAKQPWLAWLLYGEADTLLRPANFTTSTNLDRLRSEQRTAVPGELAEGIGPQIPLVIKSGDSKPADGTEFRFIAMNAEGSGDGSRLNLMLHIKADWIDDPAAARARNLAAARAMLDAHKELRKAFDGVWVFAETKGHDPFSTETAIGEIP